MSDLIPAATTTPPASALEEVLDDQQLRVAVGSALLIREVEQRLLRLYAEGKLTGTVHTCIGQEFAAVAACAALAPGDIVCSNHRGHGHYVAWTGDVDGLVAEVMGRSTGATAGRGGSQHLYSKNGFYSNGILGGMAPVATGIALAEQLKRSGAVCCLFMGDGAFGEGAVYESMNVAARRRLPLLMIVEDNLYAQSTPQRETLSGTLSSRIEAFGIPLIEGTTWEWPQLMRRLPEVVAAVRSGAGPRAVLIRTYRLAAHSKGDDDRDPAEIRKYLDLDPLSRLLESAPWAANLQREARLRVDLAVARAHDSSEASALGTDRADRPISEWTPVPESAETPTPLRFVESIRAALLSLMEDRTDVVVLGEDVRSPYGGAFKVTLGLSDRHPDRVLNMPVSEQAIVGLATGLALRGLRPFAEIMFGDFLLLAGDQLVNHAAKFPYIYGGIALPVVVRTPMGGGRGYGPTHSQSLEKHFLGVPSLDAIALNGRLDLARCYRELAQVQTPTLVFEYKSLYPQRPRRVPVGFVLDRTNEAFPWIRLRPRDRNAVLTVITYGGILEVVEDALGVVFDEYDLLIEILAPSQLHPLDIRPAVQAVDVSRRLLVVEEGQAFCSLGAELVAQIHARRGRPWLSARVAAAPIPIPAARTLETRALPGRDDVVHAVVALAAEPLPG